MAFQFTDTSEIGFQKFITNYLVSEHKYVETISSEFDREFSVNTQQLLSFIKATQIEAYEFIQQKGERSFLVRLDEKLKSDGVMKFTQRCQAF